MVFGPFIDALQSGNILMFILLGLVLFIAFRILQMFVQTLFVAFISGAFYVVLANSGTALTITVFHTVFFAFLGAALFIVYSLALPFVATAWKALIGAVRGLNRMFGVSSSSGGASEAGEGKQEKKREMILQEVQDEDE